MGSAIYAKMFKQKLKYDESKEQDNPNFFKKNEDYMADKKAIDPKKIIGEQTFKFGKDKFSENYVAGLSLDPDLSPDPSNTDDRLVITPEQKKKMEKDGKMTSDFIDQDERMNIKKDSVSGNINFYSIKNKLKKL